MAQALDPADRRRGPVRLHDGGPLLCSDRGHIDGGLYHRGGRQGDQGPGFVDPDIKRIGGHAIAPGAVRQRRHADELTIDVAAKLAGGVQLRRVSDIYGQTSLRSGRRRGIPLAAGGEQHRHRHGSQNREAGADGDKDAVVSGHGRLARLVSPITPPGRASSTAFVGESPSRRGAPGQPDSWPAGWSDRPGPVRWRRPRPWWTDPATDRRHAPPSSPPEGVRPPSSPPQAH